MSNFKICKLDAEIASEFTVTKCGSHLNVLESLDCTEAFANSDANEGVSKPFHNSFDQLSISFLHV